MLIPMSLGQQTAAVRALFTKGLTRSRTNGKKRVPRTPRRKTAKASRRKASASRLVKGSAAARRYMAKIRKMRK